MEIVQRSYAKKGVKTVTRLNNKRSAPVYLRKYRKPLELGECAVQGFAGAHGFLDECLVGVVVASDIH